MGTEIKKMLEEEIKSEIENLATLKTGSDEHSSAVEDLAKLYKLKIEEDKTAIEYLEKAQSRKSDNELKDAQLKETIKDRYFRIGIAAAELVLPLMFYATWMNKGFKFEETGTYTSRTFGGLINRFKPTKK